MRLIQKSQSFSSRCRRHSLGLTIKPKLGKAGSCKAPLTIAWHTLLLACPAPRMNRWSLQVPSDSIMCPKGWCLCRTLAPVHFRITPDPSTQVFHVDVSAWLMKFLPDMFSQSISVHTHGSAVLASPAKASQAKARFPGLGRWVLPECSHG